MLFPFFNFEPISITIALYNFLNIKYLINKAIK